MSRWIVFLYLIIFPVYLYSQEPAPVTLKGRVFSSVDNKPLEFATVVLLEAKKKTQTDASGNYSISADQPGKYTLVIRAEGLRILNIKVNLEKDITRDFSLSPLKFKGGTLLITGERNIQKLSRYTMTARELKDVPATFGDSLGALTALPGVIRTAGFFGQLVIRGVESNLNRYFIDDIPIYNPQHFFAIHSVIASDLIREIDLYASAYPANFGGASGGVININTIDEVNALGGNVDVSIISSSLLLKAPIIVKGSKEKSENEEENKEKKNENRGYVIVAGRLGYLTLVIPVIYELITGDKLFSLPEYWDYQLKFKYNFDSRHSLTLLSLGSGDEIDLAAGEAPSIDFDPIVDRFAFKNRLLSFSQGVYYTYEHSKNLKNIFLFFTSFNEYSNFLNVDNVDAANWLVNFGTKSNPYTYGFKDKVRFTWLDKKAELLAAVEYFVYDFNSSGVTLIPNTYTGIGPPNFADDSQFNRLPINLRTTNHVLSAFIENKFEVIGFTITPGVRMDYLNRSQAVTVDPRLLVSYEFKTETTLSLAGGTYSSFYQTNPYLFNSSPNYASTGKSLKPLRACHSSLGLEQKVSLFTIRTEGFYNYFWNLAREEASEPDNISSAGKLQTYGTELMLRLDQIEGKHGFFGWINYTFTQSKYKSGIARESWGDNWINSDNEQEHALKLIFGYSYKQHSISSRFQLNSSFPYTPIVDADESPVGSERYFPEYGSKNSRHSPVDHRLDLRYTYKSRHSWGFISWYIEIINVYNNRAINGEDWDYDRPFAKGSNPKPDRPNTVNLIPSFGVEVKF